jgi:hypothetical protein
MFKFIILLFCLFIIGCNLDEDSGNGKENLNICRDQIDFNSSLLQAFYFFNSVTLNEEAISFNDWVGAFNGDVCVGAKLWDTSNCNGNVCDVPVMGVDGQSYTLGYLSQGDIPTFKIYDSSEGKIYATNIMNESGEIIDAPTWGNNDFNIIHSLVAIPETGMDCND